MAKGNLSSTLPLLAMAGSSPGLIRMLAAAVAHGCIAGTFTGIAIAYWQPFLNILLSAPMDTLGRLAFLIVCAQIGAVIAVAISVLQPPAG